MKKILIAFLFLLSFAAEAQVRDSLFFNQITPPYSWQNGWFKRTLAIPTAISTVGIDTGSIYYRLTDSSIVVWTGSQWRALGGGSGLSDGDKGDITVSSSGTVWTIDNLAITNAKINDVAWGKITSVPDAVADGSTKGVASFTANDFNSSSGNISIDYTNGQAASGSNKGFLTSSDWTTFNNKQNAITPAALTKTDDTNVTLTLGGSPSTSLLNATSITVGWNGLLAGSRGGSGVNNAGTFTWGSNNITVTTGGATSVTWPTSGTFATLAGTETFTNKTLTSPKHTVQALTDGATITCDMANGDVATVTLGGNRTLAFSNLQSGQFVVIYVTQDGTGGRTLTLPASTKVINGGAGAVTLTTAAGAVDVLTFNYVGTTLYCNYGKNYN